MIVLECIDSEDQEIIIPHNILNNSNFKVDHLIHFQKSQDGMLRTIKYRMANE